VFFLFFLSGLFNPGVFWIWSTTSTLPSVHRGGRFAGDSATATISMATVPLVLLMQFFELWEVVESKMQL